MWPWANLCSPEGPPPATLLLGGVPSRNARATRSLFFFTGRPVFSTPTSAGFLLRAFHPVSRRPPTPLMGPVAGGWSTRARERGLRARGSRRRGERGDGRQRRALGCIRVGVASPISFSWSSAGVRMNGCVGGVSPGGERGPPSWPVERRLAERGAGDCHLPVESPHCMHACAWVRRVVGGGQGGGGPGS